MGKILVLGDDRILDLQVKKVLESESHNVTTNSNYMEVDDKDIRNFDLILLNVTKTKKDDVEICKFIKEVEECPLLFLTQKSTDDEKVSIFTAGADDYITKPVSDKELLARINAHLRRERKKKANNIYEYRNIRIDFEMKEMYIKNRKVHLTKKEFKICEIFIHNKSRLLTKEQIYQRIYSVDSEVQYRAITEYIYTLRKKFSKYGYAPINTVYGTGYKWIDVEADCV